MLPFIVAGVAGAVLLSALANNRESSSRKKYQKKLEDKKDSYDYEIKKRHFENDYKKRTAAFHLLREEVTQLIAQRDKLYDLQNLQPKGSSLYEQINQNIAELSMEIEEKELQAKSFWKALISVYSEKNTIRRYYALDYSRKNINCCFDSDYSIVRI